MLYEEGQLTEVQARKIIGEKMVARIDFLNDWMKKNGYFVMLHSTYKSNVPGIFSEEGLHYPVYETTDSKNEILEYTSSLFTTDKHQYEIILNED